MKIALLTKYDHLAASTRQRFNQYSPYLKESGFELIPLPLLDNAYLVQLYSEGKRNSADLFSQYWKRFAWTFKRNDVDLIWLNYELFPYLPGFLENLVKLPGKPIVFDYDDAVFHNYDQHSNPLLRGLLSKKLHTTIRSAQLVLAGNNYLADYARPLCPRVEIVPTILDTSVYSITADIRVLGSPTRVGWIGTPSTWHGYMSSLTPLLIDTLREGNSRLAVMGAGPRGENSTMIDFEDWSELAEVPFLQGLDVGLMPLQDTPFARGKCGYKLIQYMACGVPVIASPVGVNSEIVDHGVNGFLASTNEEWQQALKTLLNNPDLRRKMGFAGREKVEREYSLKRWGPRVTELFTGLVSMGTSN